MAQRKPLVVVSGQIQELSGSDTLAPSFGDLLAWDSRVKGESGFGAYHPYVYGGTTLVGGIGAVAGAGTSAVMVYPSGADTSFRNNHISVNITGSPAATFLGVFHGSAACDMYRQAGFIFDGAAGLSTNAAHAGFIGVLNRANAGNTAGTGLYSSLGNTDLCIGVGRDEGDPANAAYLFVGNGTARTKTLLTRTGSGFGASTGLSFKVQIAVAPAATAALINVMDLSNDYPCLSNFSVSLASFPTASVFGACVGSASGASSSTVTYQLFGFSYSPYPNSQAYATSASNITGNAATATTLATPRNIQGVAFNGSANIDVISIGTTAPASPVLNQLWIQT